MVLHSHKSMKFMNLTFIKFLNQRLFILDLPLEYYQSNKHLTHKLTVMHLKSSLKLTMMLAVLVK